MEQPNDRQKVILRLRELDASRIAFKVRYITAPDGGYIDFITKDKADMFDLITRIGCLADNRKIDMLEYGPRNIHISVGVLE